MNIPHELLTLASMIPPHFPVPLVPCVEEKGMFECHWKFLPDLVACRSLLLTLFFSLFVSVFTSLLFYIRQVHFFLSALRKRRTKSTYHIQECLLKGKLFTCIMFADLPSLIFLLVSYVTWSDSHRWIPTLLFEQLPWAIIATSIEFQKNPPSPQRNPK